MKWLPILTILAFTSCQAQNDGNSSNQDNTSLVYQDIGLEEFESLVAEKPNAILLDLRTPAETQGGTIPGAIELNFRDPQFAERLHQLDREKTYIVYCASGGRSTRASQQMQEAGFGQVYNLKPGYRGWKAAQ
ncbi:MAG: rhodanese-like domain-containing protein [Bacteroidota bacterium]